MYYNMTAALRVLTNALEAEATNDVLDHDPYLVLEEVTSMDQVDPSIFIPVIHFSDGSTLSNAMRTTFLVEEYGFQLEYWIRIHQNRKGTFFLQTHSAFEDLPAVVACNQ